ncbi:5-oxoprolinase/urea amidolyase family protein [Castellaniella sp.]|uniref:5-oxoprolinase subunit B/C family protein n=1 Tax=Castellaniella sp. TaxID=1955812 RepID=UPI003C756F54
MSHPRFLPAGDAALLLELHSLDVVLAVFQVASRTLPSGIVDLVPAARTLLVQFDPVAIEGAAVKVWLQHCLKNTEEAVRKHPATAFTDSMMSTPCIEIPVHYNGEDLDAVAETLHLGRDELIERHTGTDFVAAFAGFAPGFVYLAGGDPCFHRLRRRQSPRTRVPAGSVAAAGGFSAVYPSDSPGGWQLLGVTPLKMWDLDRQPPALVQPGCRVRFCVLPAKTRIISLPVDVTPAGTPGPECRKKTLPPEGSEQKRSIQILKPGMQTLFQDFGRPGKALLGVSPSGALDQASMMQANYLVSNPPEAAVLENAGGGLEIVVHGRVVVAVTGAVAPVAVTRPSGMRAPAAAGHALVLGEGDTLRIGTVRAGVRCYLAVQGGFDVAKVLGSLSTDVLAHIGPPMLRTGDLFHLNAAPADSGHPLQSQALGGRSAPAPAHMPEPDDVVVLDIVLGPRLDWFRPGAGTLLQQQCWQVTPQSNRVGMRLSGAKPLLRQQVQELPSEGTVMGAIQVPANGQPVLFLADHPLTGGYPVIAVVHRRHHNLLGQIPVGAQVRFNAVSV